MDRWLIGQTEVKDFGYGFGLVTGLGIDLEYAEKKYRKKFGDLDGCGVYCTTLHHVAIVSRIIFLCE